jgi:hypothetical protein
MAKNPLENGELIEAVHSLVLASQKNEVLLSRLADSQDKALNRLADSLQQSLNIGNGERQAAASWQMAVVQAENDELTAMFEPARHLLTTLKNTLTKHHDPPYSAPGCTLCIAMEVDSLIESFLKRLNSRHEVAKERARARIASFKQPQLSAPDVQDAELMDEPIHRPKPTVAPIPDAVRSS